MHGFRDLCTTATRMQRLEISLNYPTIIPQRLTVTICRRSKTYLNQPVTIPRRSKTSSNQPVTILQRSKMPSNQPVTILQRSKMLSNQPVTILQRSKMPSNQPIMIRQSQLSPGALTGKCPLLVVALTFVSSPKMIRQKRHWKGTICHVDRCMIYTANRSLMVSRKSRWSWRPINLVITTATAVTHDGGSVKTVNWKKSWKWKRSTRMQRHFKIGTTLIERIRMIYVVQWTRQRMMTVLLVWGRIHVTYVTVLSWHRAILKVMNVFTLLTEVKSHMPVLHVASRSPETITASLMKWSTWRWSRMHVLLVERSSHVLTILKVMNVFT